MDDLDILGAEPLFSQPEKIGFVVGGIVGSVGSLAWSVHRRRLPFWRFLLDTVSAAGLGGAIGHFVGR